MIPELENAVVEIERTIAILRRDSIDRWAGDLERWLADVRGTSSFGQRQALFRIGEVCHPKALGDVAVSDPAWNSQLDRLYDTCAKAFNRLEKNAA
jgi:hypothetical protein